MAAEGHNPFTHQCALIRYSDDIVNSFIDTGIFVNFRRKFKRCMMISQRHPLCRFHINSLNLLRHQEQRHLIYHYNMIHPFSMFNFYWKVYMFFVLIGTNFIWPSLVAYITPLFMAKVMVISNCSYVILIVLSFFIGYHDKSANYVVMESRRVAIRYIKTYFILDIFTILPAVIRIIRNHQVPGSVLYNICVLLTWILPFCSYARYPYLLSCFKEMKIYYGINHYIYEASVTFMNFMFFLLFTVTMIYVIIGQFREFDYRNHLDCVQSSLQMILMVSHGYHNTDHIIDKIFPIFFITFGFVFHLMILVLILQIWYQFYSTEHKQLTIYNSIDAFMRYQALPPTMRQRILLYLDFKYQRHFYKESSILRATSPSLRREILVKISKENTQEVDIFKTVPERILDKLRGHLITIIFLPGDRIIRSGSRGRSMFFIKFGTVKITTSTGKEICRLRDGSHFGEIALVANVPRVANVTAVTPCELYILDRIRFLEVFNRYPKMLNSLTTMATERIAHVQSLAPDDTTKNVEEALDDPTEIELLNMERSELRFK